MVGWPPPAHLLVLVIDATLLHLLGCAIAFLFLLQLIFLVID